jgi:hypothetical protein
MSANHTQPRKWRGATGASTPDTFRLVTDGPVVREVPAGAKLAKRCHCKADGYEPWIEVDEDLDERCIRCGRQV